MQYKGIYTFRFNAETLIRPYDKMLPEFTGASMNTAVQITLPKRTVATIGGMHSLPALYVTMAC